MNAGVKTVTCTDPQTLVVTTEFPTTLLTQAYVPILPKHIWSKYTMEQIGNAEAEGFFANEPPVVGSGPYTVVQWEAGQFIRFVRNDKYWGKRGVPDEIIFQTFSGADTMVQALKSGELDYIRGVGADQFDALAKEPDIETVEGFSNGYTYLSFNTRGNQEGYNGSTSALADVKFRDALGFAIDNQKLVDAVFKGHGVPGTTNVPPYHVRWHVAPATPRRFDIAEANRRLDAAGYARNAAGNRVDKEGKEIVLRLTWPDSESGHSTDAQYIQGWFKELGVGVDAFVTEEAKLTADLLGPEAGGPANWDFYMWGWTGDPDPMSLLSFFTTDQIKSGINDSFFSNARYDELFKLQQRATDETQRHAYIDEMQQIFYDQAAYDVLYYDSELHAYRTDKFGGWTRPAAGHRHTALRVRLPRLPGSHGRQPGNADPDGGSLRRGAVSDRRCRDRRCRDAVSVRRRVRDARIQRHGDADPAGHRGRGRRCRGRSRVGPPAPRPRAGGGVTAAAILHPMTVSGEGPPAPPPPHGLTSA